MKHTIIIGKDKGTIVFIHGNSSSSNVFKTVLQSKSINQTKITIDLPGHGNNLENTKAHDFSVKSYSKSLISILDKIDDDILLVGNSFGGHLAIEISTSLKRLKGILIFGTPPIKKPINFQEAFLPAPELQTFFIENPLDSEIEQAANILVFNKENAVKITTEFKKTDPKVRKAAATDLANNSWSDQFQIFTNLNIPKFIIAGKNDPIVNRQYLENVKNQCNGSCEILYFDDCGHYPSIEKPEEFTQAIKHIAHTVFNPE